MHATLALLIFFAGLVLLVLAVRQRRASLEAWSWPTVSGIMLLAEVVPHPGLVRPTYATRVRYDYSVDGRLYHGDCISSGMHDSERRGYPDSLVLRYAPGNVALIHHHPTDPARSVLEIHPRGAGMLAGSIAMALLAASALALIAIAA